MTARRNATKATESYKTPESDFQPTSEQQGQLVATKKERLPGIYLDDLERNAAQARILMLQQNAADTEDDTDTLIEEVTT